MGGGGGGGISGYNYTAALMIGLCEGPVVGVLNVWSGKEKTTLDKLSLSVALGTQGQAVWDYLLTSHQAQYGNFLDAFDNPLPAHTSQAIGYTGLCHVDCPLMQLGSNADVPNLSFEVQGQGILAGQLDAKPDFIITDFLTNSIYGAGWSASKLADLTPYATYCRAAGLFISPAFTEQQEAAQHIRDILQATNSDTVWSQGKLKIIPYADAAITGNGVTFTPDLTPIYDLNDDDFIVSRGEDPVTCSRITTADAYNHIQIEFINRNKDYNIEIAEARDQADIEAKGLRTMDPIKMHMICDPAVARVVAQLVLQRTLYIRNTYQFRLGWKHCLLEPMDLVTITDTAMGLDKAPVKITEIEEDEEGLLAVTAEEYPFGVNSHALYPHQDALGYVPNYQVAPGSTNQPVIFECPYQLAPTGLEVWLAASGGVNWGGCEVWISEDDTTYTKAGTVQGGARHGVLSASLATGTPVDNSHTLAVDLTVSRGLLYSGSQQDADSLNTLCYVDGEFLAYKTATLTATSKYNLTYLVRGAYGSTIAAHNSGTKFVRIDQGLFRYPFRLDQIGKTIFIKLVSFNIYGGATESLDSVSPYTYTITGAAVEGQPPADVIGLEVAANKRFVDLTWLPNPEPDISGYEVRLGASWAAGTVLVTGHKSSAFSWQPTQTGNLQFWVKAIDNSGNYSVNASTAVLVIASASVVDLTQQVVDNNVLLRWSNVAGTYDIDYVELRRGLTFGSATVVGRINGTFSALFESAAGTYKYWVVPVDIAGLYGAEQGVYAVVNQPPDFVLKDERALALNGTFTSCLADAGNLYAPVNITETYQQHFTSHSWNTPQDQITAGFPYFLQPPPGSGQYVETIDYGATIPNTKISLALTKTALVGNVTITPTISVSANGSTWTDYAGVYEVYAVNFRYVKITLAFSTADSGLVVITDSTVRLDVKLKTLQGMASAVSTDAGGTAVDITGQFLDVQSITLTPQGTTSATAIYDFVDAPNPTQFKILLFNPATGARISGTVSWAIRGV